MKVSDVFDIATGVLHDTVRDDATAKFKTSLLYQLLTKVVVEIQSTHPESRMTGKGVMGPILATAFTSLTDDVPLDRLYLPALVDRLAAMAFLSEAKDDRDRELGRDHQASYETFFKPVGS